jgi:DNA modification methylase
MKQIRLGDCELYGGECLAVLPTLPAESVDAVICDPPYPMIKRPYGVWTEAEWWEMMMGVCREVRRILKPTGSAVFVLQPNSRKVSSMRGWLWEFMAWACREWNMVQDAWWWNTAAIPQAHAIHGRLMRPSIKACVWLGLPGCWRDQDAVLWSESQANAACRATARCGRMILPSGHSMNKIRGSNAAVRRGGVTPFNVLPFANTNSMSSAGSNGHGAGTPLSLMRWWTRYICPPGGTVLDPFGGSGTGGLACLREGRKWVGIERMPEYVEIARKRIEEEYAKQPKAEAA